ncbi:MAG: LysR family transcriptional regulator [Rhodococcus sp.]|nr:LysR family transcriptional regulator [Rhodococcus sp. (in: high G+C Gram-positive bacteria)]
MDELDGRETASLTPLLAAFLAAAEAGHVTRAAEVLGVPQSSLSRRLRAAEKVLGFALFQPVGRRVALTAQGRDLFEQIRRPMHDLDHAIAAARANADPEGGLVRFGFPLTLGPVSIPALLADFHAHVPRMRLQLVQAHGEALAAQIRDGRLDLAVMIPAPADLPSTVIGRQRIRLVVAREHRLASKRSVGAADLADEQFVANPQSYHLRQLTDAWCAEAGFTPRVAFEITEFDTLRSLVAHGMGVALLPDAETPQPGTVSIPLVDAPDRSIGLVSGHHRPTAAVAMLHDHIAHSL